MLCSVLYEAETLLTSFLRNGLQLGPTNRSAVRKPEGERKRKNSFLKSSQIVEEEAAQGTVTTSALVETPVMWTVVTATVAMAATWQCCLMGFCSPPMVEPWRPANLHFG